MYLLPVPEVIKENNGICRMPYQMELCIGAQCPHQTKSAAVLLKTELEKESGFCCSIRTGERKNAFLYFQLDTECKEEAYKLNIESGQITIKAGSYPGFLYGVQTLRQIVRQEGTVLSTVTIADKPVLANRGFYHDVTRGRIPTLETLKELADTLSFYKMNQLQLYIEHSFLFEGFSEVWRDDTPLTAEEIIELDEYCISRGIELVPSLSSFGHLYKVLMTKTYAHMSEFPMDRTQPFSFQDRQMHHTLNVTLEESFPFVTALIDDFMPLFTSGQFNIGADETFDLGKGATKEYAQKVGTDRLYMDFVKKLCEYVVEKGKRPMFWGDVICGFPELIHELPKETVCLNWGYAWNQVDDHVKALSKAGATQYVCPGAGGWNLFINIMESAYSNISRMCRYGRENGAIGMLNTDWGDYGHINHPRFSYPGLIYGAAFSWSGEELPFEEINKGISVLEYEDASGKVMEAISSLSKCVTYNWDKAVQFKEKHERNMKKEELVAFLETSKEQMMKADDANAKLEAAGLAMQGCMRTMAVQKRSRIREYLIAAEGMKIFNEIGLLLLESYAGDKEAKKKANALAESLEIWFLQYKQMWRSVSKESELYRIAQVIFWYADMLRDF